MTTTSTVVAISAKTLKQLDPRRFDREYSKWVEWQWEDEWYVEDAKDFFCNKYKLKGIDIDELHYNISYSQGDYGSFSGRVYLADWMLATQTCPDGPTYAERYPALYLACDLDGSYMNITGEDSRRGWRADFRESWGGVGPCGIFANLPEEDWDQLVEEQAYEADLETEIRKYCQSIGGEIYSMLRDSYEASTSEDEFIASCEANGVTFEIETEEYEDEIHCEGE